MGANGRGGGLIIAKRLANSDLEDNNLELHEHVKMTAPARKSFPGKTKKKLGRGDF